MIKFENLRKEYKSKKGEKILALDGFSLNIADNEVFALAGINGAGKTTVLKALFGLIKLDEGSISITLPDSKKPKMSFAPEIPDLPDYLSVEEVLALSCRLANEKPLPDTIEKAMTMFELLPLKNKLVSTVHCGSRSLGQHVCKYWANVAKTTIVCQKCEFTEAFFKEIQIRSADEPSTIFYKCCDCGFEWREG